MSAKSSRSTDPIHRVLVVGTSRLAGRAIADRWADRYEVVRCESSDACERDRILADADADLVVYCGPASEPSWSPAAAEQLTVDAVAEASAWAQTADRFVVITSDALFTGPYMFHGESCDGTCGSPEAAVLQGIESAARDANSAALVVRTHVFAGDCENVGLVESILADDEIMIGGGGHASPILGRDLADLLERAVVDGATGIVHIAGGERVSAPMFAERLREAFDLPRRPLTVVIGEHRSGFASGDRALSCGVARSELGLSMPLLTESFARLREDLEGTETVQLSAAA